MPYSCRSKLAWRSRIRRTCTGNPRRGSLPAARAAGLGADEDSTESARDTNFSAPGYLRGVLRYQLSQELICGSRALFYYRED